MKERQQLVLQLGREINEQIAAGDEVKLRERRIHDHVVRCKNDRFANGLADQEIAAFRLHERTIEPRLRHVRGNARRVDTGSRLVDGIAIEIGGEDLHPVAPFWRELVHRFPQHDRDRIRLFSRRATRYPRAHRLTRRAIFEQHFDALCFEHLPCDWIAEEVRHPDQQFFEKQFELLRVLPQVAYIIFNAVDLMDVHAPLYAAIDRVFLVQ